MSKRSWQEVKKDHRNTRLSVTVTLRGDLLDEVDRLETEMLTAAEVDKNENREPTAPQIAAQIKALQDEAAESEVEFTFEGLGRGAHAKLIAKHPPTPDQQKDVDDSGQQIQLPYNPETFPPALMAACCVRPSELHGDVEEFTEIHTEWNPGQVAKLWNTCAYANTGVGSTPKSQVASELLRRHNSENS